MKPTFETTGAMSRRRKLSPAVLPDELIYEILLKLPVESLQRFRCVCKSWKTLISNPQFAKDHIHNSISGTFMTHLRLTLVYDHSTKAVSYSMNSFFENPPTLTQKLTFNMEGKHNQFIGSINGLLCLCDASKRFRLWNPCTRLISRKSPAFPRELSSFPNNAFLGYDKVNDKYKVLAFGFDDGYGIPRVVARLYTFGESNWRTTIQDLRFRCGLRKTFVNGKLHWLTVKGDGSTKLVNGYLHWLTVKGDGAAEMVIVSFDVENETLGEVLLPPKLEGKFEGIELDVSNNYLYVWQYSHRTHLVLWLMKEYGVMESWTKVMTIPHKFCICRCNAPRLKPLCILGNGVVVLRTVCSCSYLVLYDSKNGQFGHRCSIKRSPPSQWHRGIYHESLISPP